MSLITERRVSAPWGLAGGEPGRGRRELAAPRRRREPRRSTSATRSPSTSRPATSSASSPPAAAPGAPTTDRPLGAPSRRSTRRASQNRKRRSVGGADALDRDLDGGALGRLVARLLVDRACRAAPGRAATRSRAPRTRRCAPRSSRSGTPGSRRRRRTAASRSCPGPTTSASDDSTITTSRSICSSWRTRASLRPCSFFAAS